MQAHSIGKESPVRQNHQRIFRIILIAFGIYCFIQYFLPLFLPFILGAALALAAEPAVRFFSLRLRLPRALSAGIGVTGAFAFLALGVMLLGALALRELRLLAGILPSMEDTLLSAMDSLSRFLTGLARKAPQGLQGILSRQVTGLFTGSAALLDKATGWLLSFATGILGRVPGSALTLATAVISSFMISAKLPRLREFFRNRFPREKLRKARTALIRVKSLLGGWLKAQLKLCGITFLLCAGGLLLLGVSHSLLIALAVAFVDTLPILGVGAALIPWSLVAFLQGNRFLAFGLLGLYAACAVTRSVLEPRLLGKQLGLDPLVTLIALYAGYRLWGFPGMILSPMLAISVTQLFNPGDPPPIP